MGDIFPHDLVDYILLRLPAKSIGRFRCVSKTWCTSLTDPLFIRRHLNLSKQNDNNLKFVFEKDRRSLYSLDFKACDHEFINPELEVQYMVDPCSSSSTFLHVIGSCDGILVLRCTGPTRIICLYNPCTGEYKKLPTSFSDHPCLHRHPFDVSFGFGYNPTLNDYHVVKISYIDSNPTHNSLVDIYSLAKDTHTRIQHLPYKILFENSKCAYLNGALHWLASASAGHEAYVKVVVAFNVGAAKFYEVPVPQLNFQHTDNSVTELGGQLCICCSGSDAVGFEAWVMKKYNVSDSWTKLIQINQFSSILHCSKPLRYTESGWVLLIFGGKLFFFNPKTNAQNFLMIRGTSNMCDGRIYTESMIKLNVSG